MRKLVVVNLMSLDGFYEGPGNNVMALPLDGAFDEYNLERMKAADTVLLGGNSYEGFAGFWPYVESDSSASATNREFSRLYNAIDKVVISDHASVPGKDHPWATTTRIIKRAQAHKEIATLKEEDGKEIVMWGSRTLWNDLLGSGLVDELHLMIGAVVLGGGTPIIEHQSMGSYWVHQHLGKAASGETVALRRLATSTFEGSDNVLVRYEVLHNDVLTTN
ncbi:dihydrofolate reductase family protein [Hamadaea tsunoensis]|uniref:dihydrofolate reductase family protein n=1 Tax=Hamadaea tsunoensis TaxID=53368 RepID=UPI0004102D2E|nr:dihydrofolate reductase family protein [Hamadaea tsunoensis]